MNKIR